MESFKLKEVNLLKKEVEQLKAQNKRLEDENKQFKAKHEVLQKIQAQQARSLSTSSPQVTRGNRSPKVARGILS